MEINVKTLTPLWTGGVEAGKCDRIHETGILGSLRWWMEVLVRGVGGQVSDPTAEKSDHRSSLDPKKFDAKKYHGLQDEVERRQYLRNAGLCDVSQVFGATGWRRRFRLEVQECQVTDTSVQHPMKADRTYNDRNGKQKTPTWYFQNPPKSGAFTIQIQGLHPYFKPEIIGGLIQFMADWSAVGARPQMGFGVIQVEGNPIDTQPLYDWLITAPGSNIYPDLPSLQNIFLAQIKPKDSHSLFKEQDTFNLKYDLRQLFRTQEESKTTEKKIQNQGGRKDLILKKDRKDNNVTESDGNKDLRHFIMGTVDNDRIAAKIKISRAYDNNQLIRVWGWVPAQAEVYKNGWNREKIVGDIYQHLAANYILLDWREMNSARDTVTSNPTDVQAFLRSLLQL